MEKYPIDEEILERLKASIKHESDRGVVLLVIAAIDEMAHQRLRKELSSGSKDMVARLLDPPMGYLSGFMAKIDLLCSMGVINNNFHKDIRKINKLRNECAHLMKSFHFNKEIFNRPICDIIGDGSLRHVVSYRTSSDWSWKSRQALLITVLLTQFALNYDGENPGK